MKLLYRNTNFENGLITLEGNRGEVGAEYTRRNGIYRYPRHLSHVQPVSSETDRVYRNRSRNCTSVNCCSTVAIPQPESARSISSSSAILRSKATSERSTGGFEQAQGDTDKLTQTHLDNLRRNLEKRLQTAKARGNQDLVFLLERESKQLALNA